MRRAPSYCAIDRAGSRGTPGNGPYGAGRAIAQRARRASDGRRAGEATIAGAGEATIAFGYARGARRCRTTS
ncbi:hypothetical protein SCE1572_22300 [Sorangium cellulosum So0157-2]|uniref:Uncharacterized protein n=1 Tax=Sorangium cellulosum So0157-2 TaxID=1254432 RepID=S4XXB6_SORCE|nr:hypothetical protein SCE1572_22300 [Sorangium cellulosum So0157-2]